MRAEQPFPSRPHPPSLPPFHLLRTRRRVLRRHVTRLERDPNEGDFLTMHVYSGTQGKRVYYPDDPMFRGIYTNNQHSIIRRVLEDWSFSREGDGSAGAEAHPRSRITWRPNIIFPVAGWEGGRGERKERDSRSRAFSHTLSLFIGACRRHSFGEEVCM